jgi:hypothetical protein
MIYKFLYNFFDKLSFEQKKEFFIQFCVDNPDIIIDLHGNFSSQ